MKLSIITINYNNKKGLQKTIDSVISQTYKDFEWIIIDGGSTDGSKELIELYSQYITYWVSEPDKGIYNAMNKGIKVAKGHYVYFLNSGDYLVSNRIIGTIFKQSYNKDIIYGNIIYETKELERNINFHSDYISCCDLLEKNIHHQAMFFSKELFNKYGYYDENLKILADWKFNLITIGINQCSTKYINCDIAFFERNGISNIAKSQMQIERNIILNSLFSPGILADYKFHLSQNEIRRFIFSKILFSLLYRIVQIYNKIRANYLHSS